MTAKKLSATLLTAITTLILFLTPLHAKAQEDITFDTIVAITPQTIADSITANEGNTQEGLVEKKHKHSKVRHTNHSPQKATIMSTCLPGLGQIYNGKWWKTPIIYSGFGALGYFDASNIIKYKRYLLAYRYSTGSISEGETPPDEVLELVGKYNSDQLQTYKNSYLRNIEIFSMVMVLWYGLNIVDACVDGHLYNYDVSKDLSISIDPYIPSKEATTPIYINYTQLGISLKINFR